MDNPQIQRSFTHDYREPCIYMLTVTVEGRRQLLGFLEGDVYTAHIKLTPLGEAVRYELYALCKRYPQLRLLQHQVMPDHVHVILQVAERLEKPIGNLLSSWKIACGHAYARLAGTAGASASTAGASATPQNKRKDSQTDPAPLSGEAALAPRETTSQNKRGRVQTGPAPSSGEAALALREKPYFKRLFSEGYNDRILHGKGQLQRMIAYVRDNPRRLLLKRANSPFFTIHRSTNVAGHSFDAIGNLALLRAPLLAVHCRRHWSEDETTAYIAHCLDAAKNGAVLIGAFISKAEQAIAQQADEQRHSLIHLVDNGLPDIYKPVGKAFYACADGRLLLLAPWEYHANRRAITREQCNALNTLAEGIAATINAA